MNIWTQNCSVWAQIPENRMFGFQTNFLEILKPDCSKFQRAEIQTPIHLDFGIFLISYVRFSHIKCTTYASLLQLGAVHKLRNTVLSNFGPPTPCVRNIY